MEHNYAKMIELARDARIKYPNLRLGSVDQVSCAHLLGEMADALTTVCRQNRNLRHDLAQVERDYEANLEELLKTSVEIENLKDDRKSLKEELMQAKRNTRHVYAAHLGDVLHSPFGRRRRLKVDAPGMLVIPSMEDSGVQYLEFPDGLRLRFEGGKYAGWYLPGGAEE